MGKKLKPLWAPWRIEYILSPKNGECFLCNREKDNDKPDDFMVIARGKKVFVILNAYPYNSGHLMITPYEHIGDISSLSKETLHEMMEVCTAAKNTLNNTMNPDGFNIGFNLGTAAGAGLKEHIHMHIVPRWIGDTNFMPVIDNTRVIPQALRDTADILRKKFVFI
ncbi:MAG: HIT domain-containing protein [Victivallales bacterium]|nr:HIT domain-containing protein [Victivallales bacterium]